MHKQAIAPLVFSRLFPAHKPSDPTSLQVHIIRNLIPEVRSETICFYGPIDCLESRYPGLDYANPAHRTRLRRFPWHRRLFRVFDELRLSEREIHGLCRWEGTRWARERYEKEEGVKIRDTTWDDIEPAVRADPVVPKTESCEGADDEEDLEVTRAEGENGEEVTYTAGNAAVVEHMSEEEDMEDSDAREHSGEEESEDELQQSIGVELNQRLLVAIAARARGEEVVLDEDWEQWLKEAAERGAVPGLTRFSQASF